MGLISRFPFSTQRVQHFLFIKTTTKKQKTKCGMFAVIIISQQLIFSFAKVFNIRLKEHKGDKAK